MSGAKLLDFGSVSNFGTMDFPDLVSRLENHLGGIRALPDLENLIRGLKPLIKDDRYNEEERSTLKRLRQRAYDKKRNPKTQMAKSGEPKRTKSQPQMPRSVTKISRLIELPQLAIDKDLDTPKSLPMMKVEMPSKAPEKILPQPKTETFAQGVFRGFASIDGEQFVKTFPRQQSIAL